jgi:pimeloyl-ACP methyl ester carboxylesterase
MESTNVTVGDRDIAVSVDGPDSGTVALLLSGVGEEPSAWDEVAARLHNSDMRTVVPHETDGLTTDDVVGILDGLGIKWVHLVGNLEGAELAWRLASGKFGRYASLVAADRGHPAVPCADGVAPGPEVGRVELPTTIVVCSDDRAGEAEGSGRYVYGDFRVVELGGVENIPTGAPAELASEIVLRSNPW